VIAHAIEGGESTHQAAARAHGTPVARLPKSPWQRNDLG
jgi:hypothetical protein